MQRQFEYLNIGFMLELLLGRIEGSDDEDEGINVDIYIYTGVVS